MEEAKPDSKEVCPFNELSRKSVQGPHSEGTGSEEQRIWEQPG